MAADDFDDLIIPALSALSAAPQGAMTLADLSSHLETRYGSTDEAASDATSVQSRSFRTKLDAMLSDAPGSLAERGLVQGDATSGVITITPVGRQFVGR